MREHFYTIALEPLVEGTVGEQISYFQRVGILATFQTCPTCSTTMAMKSYTRNVDGRAYRCMVPSCTSYKKYFSIRKNSVFDGFKFSLKTGLKLMWKWLGDASQKEIRREADVDEFVLIKFYERLRLAAEKFILYNPQRLGGNNVVCQLDESLFRHKPKYHRGRATDQELWVFGIADTSYQPSKIYLELVERRDAVTLLPIIRRVCRPNSIIISDEWAAYRNAEEETRLSHLTVNHSLHFVDPNTGAHTQNIESYWAKVKLRIKVKKGVFGEKLESYLSEWMWKDNVYCDKWQNFLDLIKLYHF